MTTVAGGTDKDSLFGGAGNDIAEYEYAPAGVTVDLAAPGYQDTGGAGLDFLNGVEAIGGSKYPDKLYGTSGANELHGREGADNLAGRGGDDFLLGGPAKDVARYAGAPAGVTIDLDIVGFQNTKSAGLDQLVDIESLAGTSFADQLRGDEHANTLKRRRRQGLPLRPRRERHAAGP